MKMSIEKKILGREKNGINMEYRVAWQEKIRAQLILSLSELLHQEYIVNVELKCLILITHYEKPRIFAEDFPVLESN